MNRNKLRIFIITLTLALGLIWSTGASASERKLWAIYLLGTNLESGSGFATTNLNQLLEGYAQAGAESGLDVILAFGGSKKENWQGMKFADLSMIVSDGQDGVYGNLDHYLYQDDSADMGAVESLTAFLEYVKANYSGHAVSFFSMWDHGSAYSYKTGVGPDEVTHSTLTLSQIRDTLSATGSHFDIIGFDACLMANLATAVAVKDHCDYLLASEELEPGHGWNYEHGFKLLSSNNTAVGFGKAFIDSYVDDSTHAYVDKEKTLSLLDVSQAQAALEAVNVFGNYLTGVLNDPVPGSAIVSSYGFAQGYFYYWTPSGIYRDSSDLYDLALLVKARASGEELKAQAQLVLDQLDSLILHSANDGGRPDSYGVAIAPLDMYLAYIPEFQAAGLMSQGWIDLINAYQVLSETYTGPPPTATDIQNNVPADTLSLVDKYNQPLEPDPLRRPEPGTTGLAARFDGTYVNTVSAIYGRESGGQVIILNEQEAMTTDDGIYYTPKWDGGWARLTDQATGEKVFIPLVLVEQYPDEEDVYKGSVYFSKAGGESEWGQIEVDRNVADNSLSAGVTTFTQFEGGGYISDRNWLQLEPGDTITFLGYVIDKASGEKSSATVAEMTLQGQPKLEWTKTGSGNGYLLGAVSINNLYGLTPLFTVEPTYGPK